MLTCYLFDISTVRMQASQREHEGRTFSTLFIAKSIHNGSDTWKDLNKSE